MLKDKNVVVTGGSRGIGKQICLHFAQLGANIVVNYAGNENAANETVKLCKEYGVKAVAIKGNVAIADDAQNVIDTCIKEFGSIDILVNNAGVTRDNLLMRMSEDDFDAVIDTNLKGAFLCTKFASRPMLRQKHGRIINMGSVVGGRGNIGQANYAASKAGLVGFTKSIAKEFASKGVTANLIAPGFIETEMTAVLPDVVKDKVLAEIPVGTMGQPKDVANAAAFFASDAASYITGQVLYVDGGMAV